MLLMAGCGQAIDAQPPLGPVPEFVHGEECLFCHRNTIGVTWQSNRHQTTMREAGGEWRLGAREAEARALRKNGYNRFAIQERDGTWNESKFNRECARCHATAVDPADFSFAYTSIDCYSCHGDVDLKHSGDTRLVALSKRRAEPAAEVNSICAACHVRDAVAASPADGHVAHAVNARVSCLNCHSVHGNSSRKHRRAAPGAVCNDCHIEGRPRAETRRYVAHSKRCEY